MGKPVKKAIFPVGGLGTRFLPATKAIPKEMLPVVDKPLIQWAVEEARAAGIEEFIFVTGRGKAVLEDHFDQASELSRALQERGKTAELDSIGGIVTAPGQVIYTRQQQALGLGHAVWCARNLIGDEPFAVLLADDLVLAETPCMVQMVAAYGRVGGNLVAATEVEKSDVNRYGILDIASEDGPLVSARGVVEKPDPASAPSRLAVIGRYILAPGIFARLSQGAKGAGGEIQLTDALAAMIGEVGLHGLRFEGRRFDCGSKAGFLEANIAFALERDDLREEARRICRAYS